MFCRNDLLVHPVVDETKPGDFMALIIIGSYELLVERFYSKNNLIFAIFATFSRRWASN
jgi:ATP sulfurylase